MAKGITNQILWQVSRVGCLLPSVWFIGVLAYYIRAKIHLGYWARAYIPDPKSLPFEFHHWVFMLGVYPLFWSLAILPVVWIMRFRTSELIIKKEVAPFLLGWGLIAASVAIPGIDFVTWFLD